MSYPPPYRSGNREWKTLRGLERAAERLGGRVLGFTGTVFQIEWPPLGTQDYKVSSDADGATRFDRQLEVDLSP